MLAPFTIRYPVRPVRRSLATNAVADLFGIAADEAPLVVAENVSLDIRPGDVVLFTGPSGSGKSSLLREVARQLGAIDAQAIALPDVPLVDALPGSIEDRLDLLAACGLSEARLLLRTPGELSDGQRYRFRLALALSSAVLACASGSIVADEALSSAVLACASGSIVADEALSSAVLACPSGSIVADEFCAVLDRTLAKVLAFNVRKLCTRTGVGALLATTHDDLAVDLQPDVHVRCRGDGAIDVQRRARKKKRLGFANEFWLSDGSVADWAYFTRWHYRSHHPGFVRRVVVLWHDREAVGVCVFASPAASLTLRSRFFGLQRPRSREHLTALNRQLWVLARVVLHPTYRGAGVAAAFVRRACETCPVPWIETLAAMGHVNPFFERAGFVRIGVIRKSGKAIGAYGGRRAPAQAAKTRFSEPVYYIFDNRVRAAHAASAASEVSG